MTLLLIAALPGWAYALILAIGRHGRAEAVVRACHEIRGPLTAMHLALHGSARRGELSPGRVAAFELELRRAALALDDLTGSRRGDIGEVDVSELLRCQARTWGDVARANGATLALRLAPTGSVVKADALRLAQAVGNIVANAIEHGGGEIEIRTRATPRGLRIEVTDGGPGLPAPVAELVRGRRRRHGRGRGLSIAARALERQGSALLMMPSARGACLAFELPAKAGREWIGAA